MEAVRGVASPRTRVTAGCEPHVGVENQTCVVCKRTASAITAEPSLQDQLLGFLYVCLITIHDLESALLSILVCFCKL